MEQQSWPPDDRGRVGFLDMANAGTLALHGDILLSAVELKIHREVLCLAIILERDAHI
jgi:hypothetical protein